MAVKAENEFNFHLWLPEIQRIFPQVNEDGTKVFYASGWKTVRMPLDTPIQLDDPKWVREPGWKAKLCRIIGDLFGKEPLYKKGMRCVPAQYIHEREIEIEQYSYGIDIEDYPDIKPVLFTGGYDPIRDVLYVDPARTSKFPPLRRY